MNKKLEKELILILFPVTSILLTALLYGIMPDTIPVSFGLTGQVLKYTDKSAIVFLIPVLSLFFYLYMLIVPYIDKYRESYFRFSRAYNTIRLSGNAALLIINGIFILNIFFPNRIELIIAFKVGIAVGILLFGDRLPKIKRNCFVGVVNPWTLRSDYVWCKTQRFTGRLMFVAAIALLIMSFVNLNWVNAIYMSLVLALLIAPHIYSAKIFYEKSDK